MIWVVSQDIGINYGHWVRLYQSRHFKDEYPEDNERFNNVVYTEEIERDREKSLLNMRERMFSEHKFTAAVCLGGRGGSIQEYEIVVRLQPEDAVIPLISNGAATHEVGAQLE